MLSLNLLILISLFQFGQSLTLTLSELEEWKKLMKAELKQEIFLELPETEEVKRINKKNEELQQSLVVSL